MKQGFFYLVCLLCSSIVGYADKTDSLLRVASTSTSDTVRCNAYNKLSDLTDDYDTVHTRRYAYNALYYAKQAAFVKGHVRALARLASYYRFTHNMDASQQTYERALSMARAHHLDYEGARVGNDYALLLRRRGKLYEALAVGNDAARVFTAQNDRARLCALWTNIGLIYEELGRLSEAVEAHLRSLHLAEVRRDTGMIATVYNNLGGVYSLNGDQAGSLKAYQAMVPYALATGEKDRISIAYHNVGSAYNELGQPQKALAAMRQAYALEREANDEEAQVQSLTNIATVLNKLGRWGEAAPVNRDAIRLSRSMGDTASLALALALEANTATGAGEPVLARERLREALALRPGLDLETTRLLFLEAAKVAGRLGFWKDAYQYNLLSRQLADSLQSVAQHNQIAGLQAAYETERREKELAQSKGTVAAQELVVSRQKGYLMGAGLVVAALGFTVVGVSRRARSRTQRARMREEQATTRALFEGEQAERIRIARDLHDSIGQMLSVARIQVSGLGTAALPSVVLLDKTIGEVRTISHNLIPEELNFGLLIALDSLCDRINRSGTVRAVFELDEALRDRSFTKQFETAVYRIVQEVVNNMLKHADATQIRIGLEPAEAGLVLFITDNGKGFDTARMDTSTGLGWKNIRARVGLLNGAMNVRSERITGTRIEIALPPL